MAAKTTLPQEEITFLNALPTPQMHARLAFLHSSGWSLAALGRSLNRPKTTIHFWVRNALSDSDVKRRPAPTPPLAITRVVPATRAPRTRSISPRVPPDLRPRLRQLSELSRRYRAKTPPSSPLAVANRELTQLAVNLYAQGVPTADIAAAAGVSYRAMARRIALAGSETADV